MGSERFTFAIEFADASTRDRVGGRSNDHLLDEEVGKARDRSA
jgi:hypothetical protein